MQMQLSNITQYTASLKFLSPLSRELFCREKKRKKERERKFFKRNKNVCFR